MKRTKFNKPKKKRDLLNFTFFLIMLTSFIIKYMIKTDQIANVIKKKKSILHTVILVII